VPRGKRPSPAITPDHLSRDGFEKLADLDLFDETCAGHLVLGQVADKWTMLLMYALAAGTKRYGELRRQLKGISAKVLIQNLRKLEEMEFLRREVFPVVPPKVEYSLTPLGKSFLKPLGGICAWASDHLPELRIAQARRIQNNSLTKHQASPTI